MKQTSAGIASICFSFLLYYSMLAQAGNDIAVTMTDHELAKRDSIWFSRNPYSLPIWETLQEKLLKNETPSLRFPEATVAAAPKSPVRNVAEFEPLDGVLIRYPLGISVEVVKEMAKDLKVYCIVSSGGQSAAESAFKNGGVAMDNVSFVNANTDSYWTRDFSAWYIFDGDGKPGMVDFKYNRNRPSDDAFTAKQGESFATPVYFMNVVTAGGDYMCDGMGIAASTDLVYRECKQSLGISSDEVNKRHQEYLGITKFHVVADPNTQSSIDHIDCWGKFLAPDKIVIRQVPPGNADYSALENAAKYWQSQISSYGTPYKVFRITGTGGNEAYTNSTILNKKVFVPIAGTSNDAAALEVYKKAMPGYTVIGFKGSWQNTDAMHCRTHEMADRAMLYIRHIPLHDTLTSVNNAGYAVEAEITPYSKKDLIADSLLVFFRKQGEAGYSCVKMSSLADRKYKGIIPQPAQSCAIEYYLHAADGAGKSENHPYIGGAGPHLFYAKSEGSGITQPMQTIFAAPYYVRCTTDPYKRNVTISYRVPHPNCGVTISIHTLKGAVVRVLTGDGTASATTWNLRDENTRKVAAGIYYAVVSSGNYVAAAKMRVLQ